MHLSSWVRLTGGVLKVQGGGEEADSRRCVVWFSVVAAESAALLVAPQQPKLLQQQQQQHAHGKLLPVATANSHTLPCSACREGNC